MATGDDAAAAGMDLVSGSALANTIDDELNKTRDYIAQRTSAETPVSKGGTGATTAAAARASLGVTPANIGAAPSSHDHTIAQITGLQTTLNAKAALTHTHAWSEVTGKPSTYTPSSHTLDSHTGTLALSKGGTGATSASAARTALGIGSMATRNVTISTSNPSGGSNGDIWFKVV